MAETFPEIIPPNRRPVRAGARSLRYYLALMADLRRQSEMGLRSSADAQRLHQMAEREAGVLIVMQEMEMRGLTGPVDVAPLPEEGYEPPQIRPHRAKTVTVRQGTDKHGLPFEEKSVSIASNTEDTDAEIDAQIEALT
jgi:hypothetical protein